jgi:hypothetical protein
VLLLDTSGSMGAGDEQWTATKMLALDVAHFAPERAATALLVFAERVTVKIGFDQSRSAVVKKLETLGGSGTQPFKPAGRTALYDSILEGLSLLSPLQPGDVICVVSDGEDNASKANARQVECALQSSGVRLFGIILLNPPGFRFDYSKPPAGLAEVSLQTGGSYSELPGFALSFGLGTGYAYSEKTWAGILGSAHRWYMQMGDFYSLEIKLPLPVHKPRVWRLDVVDQRGKEWGHLTVNYPRRLMPCSAKSPQN